MTQRVTLKAFSEVIDKMNGLTLLEIQELAGFKKLDSTKVALCSWKRTGKISYKCKNGRYSDFKLLDSKLKNEKAKKEKVEKGRYLKAHAFYIQLMETSKIIDTPTISSKDKLKAIDLQQKALKGIPDELMAEFSEM